MPFPTPGQTLYGGWTQEGEGFADLKTRFGAICLALDAYGGKGDDATDNFAAFTAAKAAGSFVLGYRIKLTEGKIYRSSPLTFTQDNVTLEIPDGAVLKFPIVGANTNAITANVNNFRAVGKGRIEGPASGVYVAEERGISVVASQALAIASITRVGQIATVTTVANHNLKSGYTTMVTGATQPEYNGTFTVTVTGLATFTYVVTGAPATPATGAPVYNPRLIGLSIDGVEVTKFGSHGIYGKWINRVSLPAANIHDCGYAGAMFLSCAHGRVGKEVRVETIGPGTAGNMYGLSGTHDSTNYNTDTYAGTQNALNPFCRDWVVDGAFVNDIDWEGIDFHGGDGIVIINNKVYNTRYGISCPTSSGAAANYAGAKNKVNFNTIDGRKPDGTASGRENLQAYAINLNGGSTVQNGEVECCFNTITAKGLPSQTAGGVIQGEYTKGARVHGNILRSWGGVGVNMGANADFAIVSHNQFGELANPADTAAECIRHSGVTAKLSVFGNMASAYGGTAARVGFSATNMTSRPMYSGNDFKACTVGETTLNGSPGAINGLDLPCAFLMSASASSFDISAAIGAAVDLFISVASGAFTLDNFVGAKYGQVIRIRNIGTSAVTFSRANSRLAGSAAAVIPQWGTLVIYKGATLFGEDSRSLANG